MKKFITITFAVLTVFFQSCNSGNPELQNAEQIKGRSEQEVVTGQPLQDLKANAINEADTESLIKWSLGRVQEELMKSKDKVASFDEVDVLLDENLQMVIRKKKGLTVYEERVKLENLNPDVKTMKIITDYGKNPNPGFKLAVIEGKTGVEYYENGKKKETKKELEFLLGERRQVQLVISAMTTAIKTAQGNM